MRIQYRLHHPSEESGLVEIDGPRGLLAWLRTMGYADLVPGDVPELAAHCADGYRRLEASEEIAFGVQRGEFPSTIYLRSAPPELPNSADFS